MSGGKKVSFAAALAAAKPITKSIGLCLDGDLLAEADRLGAEYLEAKGQDEAENREPQAPALAERLKDLSTQIQAAEVEFVFRSIGRLAWQNLIAEHPPTKEQRELGADMNVDTFPATAMAASCISPEGADVASFEQLSEIVTNGQWNRLWVTCHQANNASGDIPNLVAAYAPARPTETS